MIQQRMEHLRYEMRRKNITYYIVPTDDYHQSEYVGAYFQARAYITGFSGSAGTALITEHAAYLWTDGRYFLQAEEELRGTGVTLMKMGEAGVPTLTQFLQEHLTSDDILGFDGRCVSKKLGAIYEEIATEKGAGTFTEVDLFERVWLDRPDMAAEPVFVLDTQYAGETAVHKIERIRAVMKDYEATVQLLTSLDDICWMLNIRGNDVEYFPLVLCYCMITMDRVVLYINEKRLDDKVLAHLRECRVELAPYDRIYQDATRLNEDVDVVLYDPDHINYSLEKCLPNVYVVEAPNPQILMKAIKNEVEIANIKIAEHKDSIAHVRFMKWLKESVTEEQIAKGRIETEISASECLDKFRKDMGNFLRPSFDPISAYGTHGAIVHYSATKQSNAILRPGALLLTDTGAGFFEGSTDVTRTFALGEIPKEQKEHFTLVVMSNLRLANQKFLQGCTGQVLDVVARTPLWERGLNYNHGTGHGVGYLLNIHEGPQAFRYQERPGDAVLEPGMVITDEPGLYIDHSHGIRLENEVLVCKDEQNTFGQFLRFEILTKIPFDLDALDPSVMTEHDIELLNAYHEDVYQSLQAELSEEERAFLREYTRVVISQ